MPARYLVARLEHTQLVATRVGQHDESVLGPLAHVEAVAAQEQSGLDGSLLILGTATGQVQVQPWPAHLRGLGGDEAKPYLCLVTRYQRSTGLRHDLAVEQRGPEGGRREGVATSNVTASRRTATAATTRSLLGMTTACARLSAHATHFAQPEFQAFRPQRRIRRKPNRSADGNVGQRNWVRPGVRAKSRDESERVTLLLFAATLPERRFTAANGDHSPR